jgi:spore germination protein YaaH
VASSALRSARPFSLGLCVLAAACSGTDGVFGLGARDAGAPVGDEIDAGGGSNNPGDGNVTDAAPPRAGDSGVVVTPQPDAAAPADAGAPDATPPAAKAKVLGYYTGSQESYAAVASFHSSITTVSADLFNVQTDGTIAGSDDNGVVARATGFGLDAFACVSNFNDRTSDFDASLAHAAMVTQRAAVVANAVKLAKKGYRGINVDFEGINSSAQIADDRAAFSAFIHDLAAGLHAVGLELLVSVPPKSADAPADTWAYPYDYAALAADADFLQVMTYDQHGPGWSGPGPVSGADWAKACIAFAASVAPPSKLLLGLPAYGYDWDLTASNAAQGRYVGTTVTWKTTAALLAKPGAVQHVDATTSSPYVDYTASDGHAHEAWYEDATSIPVKTKLVADYGLAGVSMWAMGEEDAQFWQTVLAGL